MPWCVRHGITVSKNVRKPPARLIVGQHLPAHITLSEKTRRRGVAHSARPACLRTGHEARVTASEKPALSQHKFRHGCMYSPPPPSPTLPSPRPEASNGRPEALVSRQTVHAGHDTDQHEHGQRPLQRAHVVVEALALLLLAESASHRRLAAGELRR